MRVVALLLLIANLVFFAWQYPQQQLLESRLAAGTQTAQAVGKDQAQAESLMMLKELPTAVADKIVTVNVGKTTVAADPPPTANTVSKTPMCWTLGPFINGRQADQGLAVLTGEGVKGRVQMRAGSVLAGYRVQLPQQGSKAAAQRTIADLRGRGIKDIAMLADKGSYFVSLGFFSKQASAEQRSAAVTRLGYKPLTRKIYRDESRYWLDLYNTTDEALLDEAWGKLSAAYPGVERNSISCPDVR